MPVMTELEITLMLLLGCLAGLLLLCLWIVNRMMRPDGEPSGVDPILGARDPVAIYRVGRPFIRPHRDVFVPMPDTIKGRDAMVAWMTKDLPKLMESAVRPPH